MLVLTRKIGEKVLINGDITLVVLEKRGNRVRLGIDAPRHVAVFRQELWAALADGRAGTHPQAEEMTHAARNP